MPYVLFFLITGMMGPVFWQKVELERKEIDLGENPEAKEDVEPSVEEPTLSGEHPDQAKPCVKERFLDVQYKLSYVLWKCRVIWPILDFTSRHFVIVVYCTIFVFALKF